MILIKEVKVQLSFMAPLAPAGRSCNYTIWFLNNFLYWQPFNITCVFCYIYIYIYIYIYFFLIFFYIYISSRCLVDFLDCLVVSSFTSDCTRKCHPCPVSALFLSRIYIWRACLCTCLNYSCWDLSKVSKWVVLDLWFFGSEEVSKASSRGSDWSLFNWKRECKWLLWHSWTPEWKTHYPVTSSICQSHRPYLLNSLSLSLSSSSSMSSLTFTD